MAALRSEVIAKSELEEATVSSFAEVRLDLRYRCSSIQFSFFIFKESFGQRPWLSNRICFNNCLAWQLPNSADCRH